MKYSVIIKRLWVRILVREPGGGGGGDIVLLFKLDKLKILIASASIELYIFTPDHVTPLLKQLH